MKGEFSIEDELVRSSGGVFEASIDGRQVFSKIKSSRFLGPDEIANLIREA